MTRLSRLLAPLSVAAAFAVAAPAAQAASSVHFPGAADADNGVTVSITDPGATSDTVHLIVTPDRAADLADTKVFLGTNAGASPNFAIGADGVRDARYDAEYGDSELSSRECSIYDGTLVYTGAPVTVDAGQIAFSADLPKGVVISFIDTGVTAGVVDADAACGIAGFEGLAIDYVNSRDYIDGFDWEVADAPTITEITGGRRQVALSFDQEAGTSYNIHSVVNGVRSAEPLVGNVRGGDDGADAQVVITEDGAGQPLAPDTQYSFQVQAVRWFLGATGASTEPDHEGELLSDFSGTSAATTRVLQSVLFTSTPPASTTARGAQFTWSMTGNEDGNAPACLLDLTESSGTEIPCTATGASVEGLSVGTHTLSVFVPDDYGVSPSTYTWTVTEVPATPAVPTPPAPPVVPVTPVNLFDLDGDGIKNTWLIGGKPAPAPGTPRASVRGGDVKLKLAAAPKGAKKIRVFRADGKGAYKVVRTLAPKSKTFTDTKVKPGHTYRYKVVGVNAKGQQGKASKTATARIKRA